MESFISLILQRLLPEKPESKKTERTTLTFNVTKTGGDFYLIGGSTTGESTDESDDKSKGTADNKDTQNGENFHWKFWRSVQHRWKYQFPDRQTLPAMEQAIYSLPLSLTSLKYIHFLF